MFAVAWECDLKSGCGLHVMSMCCVCVFCTLCVSFASDEYYALCLLRLMSIMLCVFGVWRASCCVCRLSLMKIMTLAWEPTDELHSHVHVIHKTFLQKSETIRFEAHKTRIHKVEQIHKILKAFCAPHDLSQNGYNYDRCHQDLSQNGYSHDRCHVWNLFRPGGGGGRNLNLVCDNIRQIWKEVCFLDTSDKSEH